jgi:hypothetical protein
MPCSPRHGQADPQPTSATRRSRPPEETGPAAQRPGSVTEGTSCSVTNPAPGKSPGGSASVLDQAAADPPDGATDLKCQKSQPSDLIL